jgi:two-component system chemotaxis response regulator CheY
MEQALGLGAAGYIVKPFDSARVGVHLTPLMQPADEQPAATLRRLGIDATRLLLYLGGLQRQLVSAGTDLAALLATSQVEAARAHLARLCEGCRTLGLHGAAAGFDALRTAPDDAGLARELEAAHRAVLRQTDATRHLAM